jgi:hypothetical protein
LNATDERYYEALRRIAVVLLTLAGLAESVGQWCMPLRSVVLWLLMRALERARGFAISAGAPALGVKNPVSPPGAIGEAARLADTFRALAAVFFALSSQAPQWRRTARRYDLRRLPGNRCNAMRFIRLPSSSRWSYDDTS